MKRRSHDQGRAALHKRRSVRGAALIEALVGILILSFGILGLVGLQAGMTRAQSVVKHRGDAAYLAAEVVGMMWLDKPNLANYATTPGTACTYQRCADWVGKVSTALPQGQSEIAVTPANGLVSLTLTWSAASEGTHTYVISTVVQ
jgi:type IV pilus assembly protein PilV